MPQPMSEAAVNRSNAGPRRPDGRLDPIPFLPPPPFSGSGGDEDLPPILRFVAGRWP